MRKNLDLLILGAHGGLDGNISASAQGAVG